MIYGRAFRKIDLQSTMRMLYIMRYRATKWPNFCNAVTMFQLLFLHFFTVPIMLSEEILYKIWHGSYWKIPYTHWRRNTWELSYFETYSDAISKWKLHNDLDNKLDILTKYLKSGANKSNKTLVLKHQLKCSEKENLTPNPTTSISAKSGNINETNSQNLTLSTATLSIPIKKSNINRNDNLKKSLKLSNEASANGRALKYMAGEPDFIVVDENYKVLIPFEYKTKWVLKVPFNKNIVELYLQEKGIRERKFIMTVFYQFSMDFYEEDDKQLKNILRQKAAFLRSFYLFVIYNSLNYHQRIAEISSHFRISRT
uniref:Uncharacterized protein n=1 Tax=Rhizophagus irregularis (strain DAOM 181602 / DAOM 197198 / MUCL 43194) TaxID=747089 RepID=U9UEZ6_RHIID